MIAVQYGFQGRLIQLRSRQARRVFFRSPGVVPALEEGVPRLHPSAQISGGHARSRRLVSLQHSIRQHILTLMSESWLHILADFVRCKRWIDLKPASSQLSAQGSGESAVEAGKPRSKALCANPALYLLVPLSLLPALCCSALLLGLLCLPPQL